MPAFTLRSSALRGDLLRTALPDPAPAAPPAPTFTSTPTDPSADTGDVSFAFTSSGATSFECAIDGGSYATCTSPKTYSALAVGSHTFAVRALNAGGTSSPSSFSWRVAGPPATPSAGTGAALLMVA
jgi:hypothetical protein